MKSSDLIKKIYINTRNEQKCLNDNWNTPNWLPSQQTTSDCLGISFVSVRLNHTQIESWLQSSVSVHKGKSSSAFLKGFLITQRCYFRCKRVQRKWYKGWTGPISDVTMIHINSNYLLTIVAAVLRRTSYPSSTYKMTSI